MGKEVLDPQEVLEAAEGSMFGLDNIGFCTKCGAEHEGIEQDASEYTCEECGEDTVFGACEILLRGLV